MLWRPKLWGRLRPVWLALCERLCRMVKHFCGFQFFITNRIPGSDISLIETIMQESRDTQRQSQNGDQQIQELNQTNQEIEKKTNRIFRELFNEDFDSNDPFSIMYNSIKAKNRQLEFLRSSINQLKEKRKDQDSQGVQPSYSQINENKMKEVEEKQKEARESANKSEQATDQFIRFLIQCILELSHPGNLTKDRKSDSPQKPKSSSPELLLGLINKPQENQKTEDARSTVPSVNQAPNSTQSENSKERENIFKQISGVIGMLGLGEKWEACIKPLKEKQQALDRIFSILKVQQKPVQKQAVLDKLIQSSSLYRSSKESTNSRINKIEQPISEFFSEKLQKMKKKMETNLEHYSELLHYSIHTFLDSVENLFTRHNLSAKIPRKTILEDHFIQNVHELLKSENWELVKDKVKLMVEQSLNCLERRTKFCSYNRVAPMGLAGR